MTNDPAPIAARYLRIDRLPYLEIRFEDGREVILSWEQKASLVGLGILFLGPAWSGPSIDLAGPGDPPYPAEGFTRDPRILALWREYSRRTEDGSFAPGPVPIPPS